MPKRMQLLKDYRAMEIAWVLTTVPKPGNCSLHSGPHLSQRVFCTDELQDSGCYQKRMQEEGNNDDFLGGCNII